ncbi:MAG: response regulator [Alphaproteobacteria bacterium]
MLFSSMSVLVLDDSENMCSILTRLLRPFGFEDSRFAGDGQEALNHLRERSVELAIVYWHMEPLNGIDFTRQMRSMKTSPDPYLPVIHLCGFTEMERIRIDRDARRQRDFDQTGITRIFLWPIDFGRSLAPALH